MLKYLNLFRNISNFNFFNYSILYFVLSHRSHNLSNYFFFALHLVSTKKRSSTMQTWIQFETKEKRTVCARPSTDQFHDSKRVSNFHIRSCISFECFNVNVNSP